MALPSPNLPARVCRHRFAGRSAFLPGVLLFLLAFLVVPAAAAPLRIGVVMDGPWAGNEPLLEMFQEEIQVLTGGEFEVLFPTDKRVTGDWTMAGVQKGVDRLLHDPNVDLLLAMGVLSSHYLAHSGPPAKPALAPFTVDTAIQAYPRRGGSSGVSNFFYLASPSPIHRDLRIFGELVPFRRLAVLVYRPYLDAIPAIKENLHAELGQRGIDLITIPVGTPAEALAALPDDVDGVYVTPLLGLAEDQFRLLAAELKRRRLPSFSYFGRSEVEKGILAGAAPETDFSRVARRTALTVQSILLGKNAGELPVLLSAEDRLVINVATAHAIGFSPTWEQLIEADLVEGAEKDPARFLTLDGVVHEALRVNLDLAAENRRLAAGEAEVRRTRAALLPQLAIAGNGLLIDGDRAEASFGSQAERSLSGSLVLQQSLYSDQLHTNLQVQRQQQLARVQERRELRLDVVRAAATGYLNVLRAKALQTIRKNNLRVTRANLRLARRRQEIGFSGPAEVYRWESQLASDRNEVLQAGTRRSLAEIELNRLLHRPAEEPFVTEEADPGAAGLLISDPRLEPFLATPAAFTRFRDFMVAEGLAEVPELQRIDRAIAAANRLRVAAKRSFWVPEVSLRADLGQHFYEGGAGEDSPFSGALPMAIPEANDTDWSVGLNLTLPLFTSGARSAELRRTEEELAGLRLQRQALADRIEQRIRSALQRAKASHIGIGLARQGAASAHKNLGLVTDAYSRGLMSIIDLIDAQNAALVADQVAANAVYDYFIDLMEVQRAIGRFDFFLDPAQRDDWFHRLEDFAGRNRLPAS